MHQQTHHGPRIYNLFPRLAGKISDWRGHLPRIAGMGFDWIFINPIHPPGFSGSLYAIKEHHALDPRLLDKGGDGLEQFGCFITSAKDQGMRVMMDLVINHTSRDAVLVDKHPKWYRRDAAGNLKSPSAVDPKNTNLVTEWGDLAELDFMSSAARREMVAYWSEYVCRFADMGVAGYRCDAAYKVPAEVWREIIDAAHAANPELLFFAENLGASFDEIEGLRDAGFDYLFNSSKWWNFHADWLLDQYERFRTIAPSVAFPESHDTERLASEIGSPDREQTAKLLKFRYLFAAAFSTGVMMPIGFEYGFRRRLHVVDTDPSWWEKPLIDISSFIAATNAMKASLPVLNHEGPLRRLTPANNPVQALLRESVDRLDSAALLLINTEEKNSRVADPNSLLFETGGDYSEFIDVTPHSSPISLIPGMPITLDALEMRIFVAERVSEPQRVVLSSDKLIEKSLKRLASQRIIIENVWPEIDEGRAPIKCTVGDVLEVWADIFGDGHDIIRAVLKYKHLWDQAWAEVPMTHFDNDRWVGRIGLGRNTRGTYTIEAWRNLFATWRRDFIKKLDAGLSTSTDLKEGRQLVETAATDARVSALSELVARIAKEQSDEAAQITILLSDETAALMERFGSRANCTLYDHELEVIVDRAAARFSAWYELFPRSMSGDDHRHGTFSDVIARLPYIKKLGFDVLYMPPIHPIGRTNRKGRNNSLTAAARDPGSPYAIGSAAGGHTDVHPELGTLEDFIRLVDAARREGIEIALDFAIQCSPDHPWVKQHPEWFDWRPDGTIKFAENPPKKYEDIVNVHFYRDALPSVWHALRDVVLFWVERGVRIFRVDNPHTKPIPFWEWMIREVQDHHPDVIFLAEAFTRPKVMQKLAKAGFSQSYTYFTWRNNKAELIEYLTELTQTTMREYFRPNFFVNTPDINPPILHSGNPTAFKMRATLAATLSAAWGMYCGFELCEGRSIPGREEYLDSEKYQLRAWDWDRPGNIRDFIARLNVIRRDNPALHDTKNLRFFTAHDDQVLFYGKSTASGDNIVWVTVCLDPEKPHELGIELPLEMHGVSAGGAIAVEDLIGGGSFVWHGIHQRISLTPENPCLMWRIAPHAS